MTAIQNVRLEIVENQDAAAALVSFELQASPTDLLAGLTYVETVELIGLDRIAGEDGRDEPIPGGRSDGSVTFPRQPLATSEAPVPLGKLHRRRLLALPAARLDEDPAASPLIGISDADELRARVTLSRSSRRFSALSNTLVLHRIVAGFASVAA